MIRLATSVSYEPKDFASLRGLKGIPDALVEAHLKLYEGYVKGINALRDRLEKNEIGTPEWSEIMRRTGFEINGMRLHELYFDNLKPEGEPPSKGMEGAFSATWRSFDRWKDEFRALGSLRGVGWVILYRDRETGRLSNHWIGLHEEGHPVGFAPLLVMDLWEHAFTGMERERYVEAFLSNVDWAEVERRMIDSKPRNATGLVGSLA